MINEIKLVDNCIENFNKIHSALKRFPFLHIRICLLSFNTRSMYHFVRVNVGVKVRGVVVSIKRIQPILFLRSRPYPFSMKGYRRRLRLL